MYLTDLKQPIETDIDLQYLPEPWSIETVQTVHTNADGSFQFAGVQPGTYQLMLNDFTEVRKMCPDLPYNLPSPWTGYTIYALEGTSFAVGTLEFQVGMDSNLTIDLVVNCK